MRSCHRCFRCCFQRTRGHIYTPEKPINHTKRHKYKYKYILPQYIVYNTRVLLYISIATLRPALVTSASLQYPLSSPPPQAWTQQPLLAVVANLQSCASFFRRLVRRPFSVLVVGKSLQIFLKSLRDISSLNALDKPPHPLLNAYDTSAPEHRSANVSTRIGREL